MFSALSGVALVGVSGVSFWYFLPRGGRVHPLAKIPFLDSMITIVIMALLVLGVALMIEGIFA
jgi:hypothetical protein